MITKITCRYSFEVLDFNCNDFGFTVNIGVSYLGIFYKTSMVCMRMRTCARIRVRAYVCARISTPVRAYVCARISMRACVRACARAGVSALFAI